MITYGIEGLPEIQQILEDAGPRHSYNLMRATVQSVASKIAKDAKTRAPKGDSGDLKKSIKAKRIKSPRLNPQSGVYVEHGQGARYHAFYWKFVEYGTSGRNGVGANPEQPFLRPAAADARANYPDMIREEFGKKLEAALQRESRRNARIRSI